MEPSAIPLRRFAAELRLEAAALREARAAEAANGLQGGIRPQACAPSPPPCYAAQAPETPEIGEQVRVIGKRPMMGGAAGRGGFTARAHQGLHHNSALPPGERASRLALELQQEGGIMVNDVCEHVACQARPFCILDELKVRRLSMRKCLCECVRERACCPPSRLVHAEPAHTRQVWVACADPGAAPNASVVH